MAWEQKSYVHNLQSYAYHVGSRGLPFLEQDKVSRVSMVRHAGGPVAALSRARLRHTQPLVGESSRALG